MAERILVKRAAAFGDVILTTPVIRRLRQENPYAQIDVETHYPWVFYRNPHTVRVGPKFFDEEYDCVIDLNGSYEKRLRRVHPIDCMFYDAFGDAGGPKHLEMWFNPETPKYLDVASWDRAVVVHPARSWPQRTLPKHFWQRTVDLLRQRDFEVIVIGTDQDWSLDGVLDTRHRFAPFQQLQVLHNAAAFLCSDSGPQTLAHCSDVPIVSLLTMSLRYFSTYERHGIPGWRYHTMLAPIDCVGCNHRQKNAVTFFECERGDNKCVTLFDPIAVVDKIERAIDEAQSSGRDAGLRRHDLSQAGRACGQGVHG